MRVYAKQGLQPESKPDEDEEEEDDVAAGEEPVPRPVPQFSESSLPRYLVEQLLANPDFERPTPI